MKSGIHPSYQAVIFLDTASNHSILTRSAIDTKGRETMKWTDGKDYPLVKVEVSSESHSFYTGKQKLVDTAGRVEKFRRRYGKKTPAPTPPCWILPSAVRPRFPAAETTTMPASTARLAASVSGSVV